MNHRDPLRRWVWRALYLIVLMTAGALFVAVLTTFKAHAAPSDVLACSWDKPGDRPFMGDVPAAVDKYTSIPADVRARLKARMQRHQSDDQVTITRDSLKGKAGEYSDLRMMHFGGGQVCGTVSRAKWSTAQTERALVYCESGHCVAVPSICRNVSLITPPARALAGAPVVPADPVAPTPAPEPAPALQALADSVLPPAPTPAPPMQGGETFADVVQGEGTPFADGALWALGALLGLAGALVLGGGAGGGGGGGWCPPDVPTTPVPELATFLLMGLGLLVVSWWACRRHARRATLDECLTKGFKLDKDAPLKAKMCAPSVNARDTGGFKVGSGPTILKNKGEL